MQELQGIELFVMLSTQSLNSSSHLKFLYMKVFFFLSFFFTADPHNLIPLGELL